MCCKEGMYQLVAAVAEGGGKVSNSKDCNGLVSFDGRYSNSWVSFGRYWIQVSCIYGSSVIV